MQGNFLSFLHEESTNVTWKSYMWGAPTGWVQFALNAGLNMLPTSDNVKRWRKRVTDTCGICKCAKQTLCHVPSNCSVSLDQGWYTWRHDSMLCTNVNFLIPVLKTNYHLFCDFLSLSSGGNNMIPSHVIVTT
jgi:hypothetical protein